MLDFNKKNSNKLNRLIEKNKNFLDNQKEFLNLDNNKKSSNALSMSVLMEYCKIDQESAVDCITDGDKDLKIDAFYYQDDEEIGNLFIIQSKYKKSTKLTPTISEDEMTLCLHNCNLILMGEESDASETLKDRISEWRKLLKENGDPIVSINLIFATNGIISDINKNKIIKKVETGSNVNVVFIDVNNFDFNKIVKSAEIKINRKNKDDKTDSIFDIDDKKYSGSTVSCSIDQLMSFYKNYGDQKLLSHNVRFLVPKSSINKQIKESFINEPEKFCYLNNGVSIVSDNFRIDKTAQDFNKLTLTKPRIINGGQTIATLYNLYINDFDMYEENFKKANILIRVYEIPEEYSIKIAHATNSQNPIRVVDLHSNDESQNIVKKYFENSGIGLVCKVGEDIVDYDDTISNENLLQLYATLHEDDPSRAKLSKMNIFKKYYDTVFNQKTNDETSRKLYRCYEIGEFLQKKQKDNKKIKDLLRHGYYSIMYCMKKMDSRILNVEITQDELNKILDDAYSKSMTLINQIVEDKTKILKERFSFNNLFKSTEIKDLIDIKIQEQ